MARNKRQTDSGTQAPGADEETNGAGTDDSADDDETEDADEYEEDDEIEEEDDAIREAWGGL